MMAQFLREMAQFRVRREFSPITSGLAHHSYALVRASRAQIGFSAPSAAPAQPHVRTDRAQQAPQWELRSIRSQRVRPRPSPPKFVVVELHRAGPTTSSSSAQPIRDFTAITSRAIPHANTVGWKDVEVATTRYTQTNHVVGSELTKGIFRRTLPTSSHQTSMVVYMRQ
jgi:hypothetical protein